MPEWVKAAIKSGLSGLSAFLLTYADREDSPGVWSSGSLPVEIEGKNYEVTLTVRLKDEFDAMLERGELPTQV